MLLGIRRVISWLAACLFAAHPLFASAVSWVPARGDLLIGLEGLLLFICFLLYEKTGKRQYFIGHAGLFFLAIFTKETAIIFPVLLLLYQFFLLPARRLPRLAAYLFCWGAVFAVYYVLRSQVMKQAEYPPEVVGIIPFLKNLPMIPITFFKFFLPYGLSTMPLFELGATIGGSVLLIVALALAFRSALKKEWLPAWGLVWMLAFFAAPLFYRLGFAQYKYTYFEFRTYLPMMGLLVFLCMLVNHSNRTQLKQLFNGMVAVIALFAVLSFRHSANYQDTGHFFGKAIEYHNPGGYLLRGMAYADQKQVDLARSDFDSSILLAPDFMDAYLNRGKFRTEVLNDHKGAEQDFTIVIKGYKATVKADSTLTNAYLKRSVARKFLQDYAGALDDLNHAKQLSPNYAEVYYRYGNLYYAQKKYRESVEELSKAIAINKDYSEAYNNRASAFYLLEDFIHAEQDYKKAIELKPDYANAYSSLGALYLKIGQPKKAIDCFNRVIDITPEKIDAYAQKGIAFRSLENLDSACAAWRTGLTYGNSSLSDTVNKYCR